MKTCISCSMPLNNPQEIGANTSDGLVCIHCVTQDGKVKKCEDVFNGGVEFFIQAVPGSDRFLAEKLVRKNMKKLPYWQKNKSICLDGEEATDEEFANAMTKL